VVIKVPKPCAHGMVPLQSHLILCAYS